ncbi:hypothetical protein SNE40_011724 [Patella caerulea]|uniref:Methyltransferase domain-containing protein n=1 Tax=Patella caerulea TaxID=87958 RepID=A0AAN8PJI1_PATCE
MAEIVLCDEDTILELKCKVMKNIHFVNQYKWLIDAYVSDFFISGYWNKIIPCWRNKLEMMSPPQHCFFLDTIKNSDEETRTLLPLSMLAFCQCLNLFSIKRQSINVETTELQEILKSLSKTRTIKKSNENVYETLDLESNNCERLNNDSVSDYSDASSKTAGHRVSSGIKASSTLINHQDYALFHVFRRHVKPKKQHEIHRLAQGVSLLSNICGCKKIVDVGAGLGHLSRILTFSKGLSVTTVEAAGTHAPKAFKYDQEMERDINKVLNRLKKDGDQTESMTSDSIKSCDELPNHVVCTISSDISAGQFVKVLNDQSFGNELDFSNSALETDNTNFSSTNVVDRETRNDNFILAGLHACGDLTPTLLRVFASCDKTVGLASVGCCYMKLTCRSDNESNINQSKEDGYPMSQFVQSLPEHQLSYAAREMACHFADSYKERLKADGEPLKVHCYRAVFQHIITTLHPEFDRGAMKLTIKNATNMPFENYCSSALKKLGYDDTIPSELMRQAKEYLPEWKNVMSFYTVRLSLGPVVETLILLDRLIYLYEQGLSSVLVPIFDPSLSPRNFLLLANKNNKTK